MPFQALFMVDRVKAMLLTASDTRPTTALELGAGAELMAATHTGMTTDEFSQTVREWISTARHPQTARLYTEMVYQPMLELLTYLRRNGLQKDWNAIFPPLKN